MRIWCYTDKSKPEIPNRDISWMLDLRVVSLAYVGGWGYHSFVLSVLGLLRLRASNPSGLNNHCRVSLIRWGICTRVCLGVYASLTLGYTEQQLIDWQMRRLIRKTPAAQLRRLREAILNAE